MTCTDPLPPRLSPENIRSVLKPLDQIGEDQVRTIPSLFNVSREKWTYVFVTAVSSNHFNESQAAIQSLHQNVFPFIHDFVFFYYDLGLTDTERELVQQFSGAKLKPFPFDKLPSRHRYLKCYTWKPLLVQAHIAQAEVLIWFDSSTFFKKDFQNIFPIVKEIGIVVEGDGTKFPLHVMSDMFSYYGDQACQFTSYQEIQAGFALYHNEPFTRELIVEPWSACAVDPSCMCPEKSKFLSECEPNVDKLSKCHRYDQAALGYIVIKLFRHHVQSILIKQGIYHRIKRYETMYLRDLQQGQRIHELVDEDDAG